MSADLLAEFESFYQTSERNQSPQSQTRINGSESKQTLSNDASDAATLAWWSTLAQDGSARSTRSTETSDGILSLSDTGQSFHKEKEEDEWGNFEAATEVGHPQTSAPVSAFFHEDQSQHRSAIKGPNLQSLSESKRRKPLPKRIVRDENILFDAEDEPEQDDFGDFETAEIESVITIDAPEHNVHVEPPVNQTQAQDLLLTRNAASLKAAMSDLSLLDFTDEPLCNDTTRREVLNTNLFQPQRLIALAPRNRNEQPADESLRSHQRSDSLLPLFEQSQQELQTSVQPRTPRSRLPGISQAQTSLHQVQAEDADDAWDVFQEPDLERTDMASADPDQSAPTLTSPAPKPSALLFTSSQSSQRPSSVDTLPDRSVLTDAFHSASPPQPASPTLELPDGLAHPCLPPNTPAPSNIPPPLLILCLFTPLIELTRTKLLDPLAASPSPAVRIAILSHPNTQNFLTSYLAIASVLARVIAGRKHRWKRDAGLAQGMRIGASGGGGSGHGGMKLMALDRAEAGKEDREVADVVQAWRASLGRLRAAVGPSRGIPEVAETLAVRVASAAEATVQAVRACALCGLKRTERLTKVDVEVLDAFGEWWIEDWGHRDCANFWTAQSDKLAVR